MVQTQNSAVREQQCPYCGKPLPSGSSTCLACFLKLGLNRLDPLDESDQEPFPSSLSFQDPLLAPSAAPRFFGDYEVLREIGRGGMGVVYEARQFGTQRTVALKLLAAGALATREAVHRFHTEAKAAALLEHSNIVPIYEVGAHDGQYFLAMRYLEGGTLQSLNAHTPPHPRDAARLLITIASAV